VRLRLLDLQQPGIEVVAGGVLAARVAELPRWATARDDHRVDDFEPVGDVRLRAAVGDPHPVFVDLPDLDPFIPPPPRRLRPPLRGCLPVPPRLHLLRHRELLLDYLNPTAAEGVPPSLPPLYAICTRLSIPCLHYVREYGMLGSEVQRWLTAQNSDIG